MERIWLKGCPADVPAEVYVDGFRSIIDVFEQSVARFANNPAYTHMGATLTYAEVDLAICRLCGCGELQVLPAVRIRLFHAGSKLVLLQGTIEPPDHPLGDLNGVALLVVGGNQLMDEAFGMNPAQCVRADAKL